jgi:hypothetical protein
VERLESLCFAGVLQFGIAKLPFLLEVSQRFPSEIVCETKVGGTFKSPPDSAGCL